MSTREFRFPSLGDTGKGPVLGIQGRIVWVSEPFDGFYVSEQHDHPAVAYRCHYEPRLGFCSAGSSPCDYATMVRFVEFVSNQQ